MSDVASKRQMNMIEKEMKMNHEFHLSLLSLQKLIALKSLSLGGAY